MARKVSNALALVILIIVGMFSLSLGEYPTCTYRIVHTPDSSWNPSPPSETPPAAKYSTIPIPLSDDGG